MAKQLEKAMPKSFTQVTGSAVLTLRLSVVGSGYIIGMQTQGSGTVIKLIIDSLTVIPSNGSDYANLGVRNVANCMYRFNSGFEFYSTSATATGISYILD